MLMLATPDDVMTDLGYDTSMTNIAGAARSALRIASATLAAALQTDFTHGEVVDIFYVEGPSDGRHGGVSTEFRLSQGFVATAPALVAAFAGSSSELADSYARADVSTAMLVGLEKGVAVDALNLYRRSWVRFAYTKGFPPSDDDPALYDPAAVPDWLEEAATIHAKISLQSNPSLEDPAIKLDSKLLQTQLANLLRPHMRYAPAAVRPTMTLASGTAQLPTATAPAAAPFRAGLRFRDD